jgi:hypothetical protein
VPTCEFLKRRILPRRSIMTEAELEAELCAIVAEEFQLLMASRQLRRTPADVAGLAAHRERLQAHTARIRAFSEAIDGPSAPQQLPAVCPICESPSVVPRPYVETYRCAECQSEWMMTLLNAPRAATDVPSAGDPFSN